MIEAGRHTIVPEDLATHVPVSIGSFCSIASAVRIVSGQHPGVVEPAAISDFPFAERGWGEYPPSDMGEGVTIGNDVWVGQDVLILDRTWIGDGARVGAGAVVTGNVGPYEVVAGNPAKRLKYRFGPSQIGSLLHVKWWDWDDEEIQNALPYMADIEKFIAHYDSGVKT